MKLHNIQWRFHQLAPNSLTLAAGQWGILIVEPWMMTKAMLSLAYTTYNVVLCKVELDVFQGLKDSFSISQVNGRMCELWET